MPSAAAVGAAASAGLSVGVSIGLGGISASVSAGAGDTEASDTIPFDDGMGASPDDDRIYEFGLKKLLRTKTIRMHERDVENAINWVAVQQAPEPSVPGSASGSPGASASLDLGGISASVSLGNAARGSVPFYLDTSSIAATVLSQERYQVDGTLPVGQD